MGRVFSWREINLGKVPLPEYFPLYKRGFLLGMEPLVEKGIIFGGKIFGSVGKNEQLSRRSDLDCLIVLQNEDGLAKFRERLAKVNDLLGFEVRPIVIESVEIAQSRIHTIDPLFYKNISICPDRGNLFGKDPLSVIRPFDIPNRLQIDFYLRHKMDNFQKAHDHLDNNIIQRALEAPVNTARMVLSLEKEIELNLDTKKEVLEKYEAKFTSSDLIYGFRKLIDFDKTYDLLLEDALHNKVNKTTYSEIVRSVGSNAVEIAREWLKRNMVYIETSKRETEAVRSVHER